MGALKHNYNLQILKNVQLSNYEEIEVLVCGTSVRLLELEAVKQLFKL